MANPGYTEAEIYVDADPAFITHIERTLADRWSKSASAEDFEVDVFKHKAYDRDADPDDFLGWRTIIWVSAAERASDQAMVAFVGELIGVLSSAGYRSTPVCSFSAEIRTDE